MNDFYRECLKMKEHVAAIIPARAGSKGVKNKNIKLLSGKPLIAHTIDAALEAGSIGRIVVSTDSEQVMEIAAGYGNVDILPRPDELATDTASGIEVFLHGITHIRRAYGEFDYYLYLQPTSPLRGPEDIEGALALAVEKQADSVVSVCECEHSPLWCNVLPEDFSLEGFIGPDVRGKNRQELPRYYRLNGAIYIVSSCLARTGKIDFFGPRSYAYPMPVRRSVDIDSPEDFYYAEVLLSHGDTEEK